MLHGRQQDVLQEARQAARLLPLLLPRAVVGAAGGGAGPAQPDVRQCLQQLRGEGQALQRAALATCGARAAKGRGHLMGTLWGAVVARQRPRGGDAVGGCCCAAEATWWGRCGGLLLRGRGRVMGAQGGSADVCTATGWCTIPFAQALVLLGCWTGRQAHSHNC